MGKVSGYSVLTTLYDALYVYNVGDSDLDGNWESRRFSVGTLRTHLYATGQKIFKQSKGADIASASALPISADGNYFDVTGTTNITSISAVQIGVTIRLHFDGILDLVHHVTNLILPNGDDITTGAGAHAEFTEYESGKWRLTSYLPASSAASIFLTDIVQDITPQLGGPLDANDQIINMSKGADVASAAALPVLPDGNYYDVTGTTNITSIDTLGIGTFITLQFDGVLTVVHHATDLITPNGQNMLTQAGDHLTLVEYDTGKWRVTYTSIVTDLNAVAFVPIAPPSYLEGLIYYDINDKALSYYNDEQDLTINIAQESIVRVYNNTGVSIPDGTIVDIVGSTGEFPWVAPSIATAAASNVLGFSTHEIGIAEFGYVTTFGIVRGPNTVGMTAGNALFVSDTVAGAYSESQPDKANESIHVGHVVKVGAAGKIFVSVDTEHTHSAYSGMYWSVTAPTILGVATPLLAAGTTAAQGNSFNFTVSVTNRITYTGLETNDFVVHCAISASKSVAGTSTGSHIIYKNGTPVLGATLARSYSSATDVGSISLVANVELATNDYVELWLENSAGDDMTVQGGIMTVERL